MDADIEFAGLGISLIDSQPKVRFSLLLFCPFVFNCLFEQLFAACGLYTFLTFANIV